LSPHDSHRPRGRGPRSLAAVIVLLSLSTTAAAQRAVTAGAGMPPSSPATLSRVGQKLAAANHHFELSQPAAREFATVQPGHLAARADATPQPLDGMRLTTMSATTAGRRDRENVATEIGSRRVPAFDVHWGNSPEWVRTARTFRRRGLPVVHLWESSNALLAIGLNRRGVPGIYFTQKLPN
jgi:hypothetical protein